MKLLAHLKFRHQCLHFVKEFARSMMSYNLLIEAALEGWEQLVKVSGFNDRPEMHGLLYFTRFATHHTMELSLVFQREGG